MIQDNPSRKKTAGLPADRLRGGVFVGMLPIEVSEIAVNQDSEPVRVDGLSSV